MQKTLPPNHEWVETEDGSFTLFSKAYAEACHSSTGAKTETLLHYVSGCEIEDKIQSPLGLTILEVGFGLGIGFLTTYEVLKKTGKPWSFISMEIDEELLKWFCHEHRDHEFLKHLQWKNLKEHKFLEAQHDGVELVILCGDARKTLPLYAEAFEPQWNAIYQDAFSPKRNPVLWTVEWFTLLKDFAHPSTVLSTYSSSSAIRKSLLEAGWSLQSGDKFGPKRSSTRARLEGKSDPEILERLERSPVPALQDDNIEAYLQK
jgi:tRNA U34 5-methylaminomethyl-2-thiouridine-forming methyltransferase MnmC